MLVEPDKNFTQLVSFILGQVTCFKQIVSSLKESLRLVGHIINLCDNEAEKHWSKRVIRLFKS